MCRLLLSAVTGFLFCCACLAQEAPPQVRSTFRVRYVVPGSVYIEGGRDAGLVEGTQLVIRQSTRQSAGEKEEVPVEPGVVAHLRVVSVAATSAVCDIVNTTREIIVGDNADLPDAEVENLVEKRTLGNTRIYPVVVSFTEGDPLDEDVRETVPAPPLPEINQARGGIGFDFSTIRSLGQTSSSSTEVGMVLRADITRIYGTHWNLNGYWRGRLESSTSQSQSTLQDLINRTYQLGLTYNNPDSHWTAGIGRLYLPWASSIDVIDGGYFGYQPTGKVTAGVFGGSTPDPTAWNYDPHRRLAGTFVNTRGGSYDNVAYSLTAGFGVSMLGWQVQRPFVFTESSLSYKRNLSIYQSMQMDRPTANPLQPPVSAGVGQSLLTLRIQPYPRLTFGLTHTYFRDVPTYDSQLAGTGLLDKYLFQGLSGNARVELPRHVAVYFDLGRSSTSTDAKSSLNTMYGATWSNIWRTGLQADTRYSRFNSTFAQGTYRTLSLSRDLTDALRLNMQVGRQTFISPYTKDSGSRFFNSYLDMNLGSHLFMENSFTIQRGGSMNYDQWTTTLGYRFDNRARRKENAIANHR